MQVLKVLVVAATGGLGSSLVKEALSRGHTVSVFVRNEAKLNEELGDVLSRLAAVHVGDARDAKSVSAACAGQDVVFSGRGADVELARVVAEQSKAQNVKKLVFVAGGSNVMSEDGVTLQYLHMVKQYPQAEQYYRAHQPCIDAIRATGINHVVFCPGLMRSVGHKSVPAPAIRINRPSGNFVSYEDAAAVMVHAAEVSDYDGQLITAATVVKRDGL